MQLSLECVECREAITCSRHDKGRQVVSLETNNVTEGERVMYNVYIMSEYGTEGERVMYNVYTMSGYVTEETQPSRKG